MRLFLLCSVLVLFLTTSKAQKGYARPDFAVQYVSYFGIGSQSVQQAAVIGNNAANYALLQQALPAFTDQGLGVPVSFYIETIKSCGADKLIDALITDYDKMGQKDLEPRLRAISERIKKATVSKNLKNQLKNAINEFYRGKKIRLSSSPNFQATEDDLPFSVTSSIEDLGTNLALVYASFWNPDNFDVIAGRFENKTLDPEKLAVGILVTQAFEYGYAIGRIQTDYTTKEPSINILSKRETSTERIGFSTFASKWYKTYQKAEKTAVFVDNAALTPTVRELQKAMVLLDPILRTSISKSKALSNKDYRAVVTFVIKKTEAGKFFIKLQQPELQLQIKK
jgi:hypothetical protein